MLSLAENSKPHWPAVDVAAEPRPQHGLLRIAFFTDDFYPYSGGVARSVQLQVRALAELGHQVSLFVPRAGLETTDDHPVVPMPTLRIPGTPSYTCTLRFGDRQARQVAEHGPFDVLHSHNERGGMVLAAKVARRTDAAHVHTFHSNYAGTHATTPALAAVNSATFLTLGPLILGAAARNRPTVHTRSPRRELVAEKSGLARHDWRNLARFARNVDAFTSPARYVVDSIVDASKGELAERAHVVKTGVPEAFSQARRQRPVGEQPFRFISCSRLGAEKRIDVLIRAFAGLSDAAELVVLGVGPQEAALRNLADRLAPGRVRFAGHVAHPEAVARHLADADAFVLASHLFDTQGIVLAEAAAAGVPIVYCDERLDVGVSPQNALLTKPSVAGLAAGMQTLMADPVRLANMARASREIGSSLGTQAMAENYLKVYEAAMEQTRLIP